jgi:hypothetical protein
MTSPRSNTTSASSGDKDDAVLPVSLDETVVPGWPDVHLPIDSRGQTRHQIADLILEFLAKKFSTGGEAPSVPPPGTMIPEAMEGKVPPPFSGGGADVQTPAIRHLVQGLERALASGDLDDEGLGPPVLSALHDQREVKLAKPLAPLWIIAAILAADVYFTRVRLSAGQRGWQQDSAKAVAPILVGVTWSLERSPDAQALVLRLCDVIAKRLRLKLVWPTDADEANDLRNSIYRACLDADVLECDDVVEELRRLSVIGPA